VCDEIGDFVGGGGKLGGIQDLAQTPCLEGGWCLRVEFLMKTEGRYLRDAEVT